MRVRKFCNHSLVLILCSFVLSCVELSHHIAFTYNSFYIGPNDGNVNTTFSPVTHTETHSGYPLVAALGTTARTTSSLFVSAKSTGQYLTPSAHQRPHTQPSRRDYTKLSENLLPIEDSPSPPSPHTEGSNGLQSKTTPPYPRGHVARLP